MNTKNIKEIRKKKGLTQVEVSKKAKISQACLSLLERSSRTASEDVLNRIAKALDVSIVDISIMPTRKEQVILKLNRLSQIELRVVDDLLNVILSRRHS